MKKIALFAFNGSPMCFIHVLLNGIRLREKGNQTKIIVEGEATRLIPDMFDEKTMLYNFSKRALELEIIDGVCEACSKKMGTYDVVLKKGLKTLNDLFGHPSMDRYLADGYEIITF